MSLIKQLWIGIIVILLLALGGSFTISILSAKHYLEEALKIKNIDNANSLALSLSQMEKEPVSIELLISAQFDSGHYEYIRLIDPNKNILYSRQYEEKNSLVSTAGAPGWFTNMVSFDAVEGVAQVQNGWQQYGTLTLKSHSRYAWQVLWKSVLQLMAWFFIAALFCGFVGTIILRFISSPLDIVIRQAEAIGERRFVTSDEPKTTEFQRLVRAMNSLSRSVKTMLEKETKQLDKFRRESQLDWLTELPNRSHFLNLLESLLNRDDSNSNGVIAIARVLNLTELNNSIGRPATDHALLQIAGVLHHFINIYPGSHAGRLNGSDFIVVITGNPNTEAIAAELAEHLNAQLAEYDSYSIQLPIAACSYLKGEKRNEILHKLDGALSQAELKGNRAVISLAPTNQQLTHRNLNEWREAISLAIDAEKIKLAEFTVSTISGELLHTEAPVRLFLDNDWQPAGYFMPWAARLGIMPKIDIEVIKAAINEIANTHAPIAINLSADALCSAEFREKTLVILNEKPHLAAMLWVEFPESCALRHMAELRHFTLSLRTAGCKVGLEHVGLEFTKIRELQDMGLHYLKIDGAIVRDIDSNNGNQTFLQSLCKIGQSLGIIMIAEGVNTGAEKNKLIQIGVDAFTGPGI